MPNLTKVLHDEIRRLSRKEIRTYLNSTKQAVARHRSEIAALKKKVQEQQRQIDFLQSREGQRMATSPLTEKEMGGIRFSPRSVRSHRKRLRLSAEEYAKLVGVSMQTIYHWEQGKSRPRKSQLAALVTVRGMGRREALKRLQLLRTSSKVQPASKSAP